MYLPTAEIPGFSLTDISVSPWQLHRVGRNTLRYVRRAVDRANVDAMLTLAGARPSPERDDRPGSITIHGHSAHIADIGEGIVASWEEEGVTASVSGWGVSWDDVAMFAEQSVVDPTSYSVTLPDEVLAGFELSIGDATAPDDAVMTNLYYSGDDGRPEGFAAISNSPNDDLLTLDSLEVNARISGQTITRGSVQGGPAIIAVSFDDKYGDLVAVEWIQDGFVFVVAGRAPEAGLLALANSLAPARLTDARALRAELDANLFDHPELDRATLPNGFDISVRSTGTSANVVCLHAPIKRCQPVINEASLAGEYQNKVTSTFHIDGATWITGWAKGTHAPLRTNGVNDGDPVEDVTQGSAGTFVALRLIDDATQLRFDTDDPSIHGALSTTDNDLLR